MQRVSYRITKKGLDYLAQLQRKVYAAYNENEITSLAEFDSEQDRQDWLNYNTEYDKMYNIKPSEHTHRVPIDDESIIVSFVANPLTTYCSDECIDGTIEVYRESPKQLFVTNNSEETPIVSGISK